MRIAAAPSPRPFRLLIGVVAALLCLAGAGTSGAAADTTPPTTPTGIGARFSGSDTMLLTWTLSTDNVGVQRYEVSLDGVLSATSAGWMAVITNLTCNHLYQA